MGRILRNLLGLALLGAAFLTDTQPSAQSPTDLEALARQGQGAQLQARVSRMERYVSDGQLLPALQNAEWMLLELRQRPRGDESLLGVEGAEDLAKRVIHLRNDVLFKLQPGPGGKRGDFIRNLVDAAVFSDWKLGVPASVTLAQAILESSWGRSAPGNALFGIKGKGPSGSNLRKVVEYRGGKRVIRRDHFRAYESWDESVADHAALLSKSRVYAKARAVSEDPDAYVRALQGTYASDPRYASKLSAMFDMYLLRRFDWNPRSPLP